MYKDEWHVTWPNFIVHMLLDVTVLQKKKTPNKHLILIGLVHELTSGLLCHVLWGEVCQLSSIWLDLSQTNDIHHSSMLTITHSFNLQVDWSPLNNVPSFRGNYNLYNVFCQIIKIEIDICKTSVNYHTQFWITP